jgi:parvulin-like peptidyl-prolyl isomerase
MVEEHLRADSWIETEIHAALAVRPEECAAYYSAHSSAYTQPLRIRASHIFFAAPPGSSPALVEQKRASAQTVLDRIVSGEKFADLVVESEDEASKKRGGDLNFFSASRIPADFWAAINDGRVGQSAGMIRTKLGFHVAMVTDSRPVRAMTFDEVEREIAGALENQKRSLLLLALRRTLDGRIRWIPSGMYLSGATNTVN